MYQPRRPQVGEEWAYRIGRTPGQPVLRVEVMQMGPETSKHKVRVKYLDGEYRGLDEWVPKVRLQVPWEEAADWQRDELAMVAAFEAGGDLYDETTFWAIERVFEAMGENRLLDLGFAAGERGVLEIADLDQACELLQLDRQTLLDKSLAYIDRFSVYHAPFAVSLELAQRLCTLYPKRVMDYVGREEEDAKRATVEGHYIGKTYYDAESGQRMYEVDKPRFALVREWCGAEVSGEFDRIVALEAEVERLRGIIQRQVQWLRDFRHPHFAKRLQAELDNKE